MDAFDIVLDFLHSSWVINESLLDHVHTVQLHKLVDGEPAILVDKLMVGHAVSIPSMLRRWTRDEPLCVGDTKATNGF